MRGPKTIQAEIQIRTMAMNFWATIEHSLQYKYREKMPMHVGRSASARLRMPLSRWIREMSSAKRDHGCTEFFQNAVNLVKDILSSIENLYKSSNKREVEKDPG